MIKSSWFQLFLIYAYLPIINLNNQKLPLSKDFNQGFPQIEIQEKVIDLQLPFQIVFFWVIHQ
jgi:hypothetical protein